jgi:hypothetical protein
MNTPGKAAGNWAWRVGDTTVWEKLKQEAADLKELAYVYDRLPKVMKQQVEDVWEKEREASTV